MTMAAKDEYLQFIESVKPKKKFLDDRIPDSPNYLDSHYWAALPDKDGFQSLSPDQTPSSDLKNFDVFFIHPTGYFLKHWNAPFDPESAAYERTGSHMATQASAFASTCNVYAPYYRQATYYSFFDQEGNGESAQDLAYSDISNAFDTYLEHYNNGRPFFIAGHSQGALHGQRLVHERVSKKSAKDLFIAAYLIGYILPVKYFDLLFPDLAISSSPDDQQAIISWCTGAEGFERSRAHTMLWTPTGWSREKMDQPLVCQNPMSWTDQQGWISDLNNFSIRLKSTNLFLADYHAKNHSHANLSIERIEGLTFQARHSDNSMIETKGSLIDKMKSFTVGGDLHSFDISLFWGSIRDNVRIRAHAYKK